MFEKLKALFKSKDDKKLISAENNFDELMQKVDDDDLDLDKLETCVRQDFKDINEDVTKIRQDVDDVVRDKAA